MIIEPVVSIRDVTSWSDEREVADLDERNRTNSHATA